jgi:hypothetical protein
MLASHKYVEEFDANSRLAQMGATRAELREIVSRAVDASRQATINHPCTASGTLSYLEGTAELRALFKSKGWRSYRTDNVEGVIDPTDGTIILFQNAVSVCSVNGPQPKNAKGPASERLVEESQASLFDEAELGSGLITSRQR